MPKINHQRPLETKIPAPRRAERAEPLPPIEVDGGWEDLFADPARHELESVLPGFLRAQRWFGGKAKMIRSARIGDVVPFRDAALTRPVSLVLVDVDYADTAPERYQLPLAFEAGATLSPRVCVARLGFTHDGKRTAGLLFDAWGDEQMSRLLLQTIASRRQFAGSRGQLVGRPTEAFRQMHFDPAARIKIAVLKGEQSNSTVLYGDRLLLKLFRRLEVGVNPDFEIGKFLTDVAHFDHVPPVAGAIEYVAADQASVTLGILESFVANKGSAWDYTVDAIEHYYADLFEGGQPPNLQPEMLPPDPLWTVAQRPPPPLARKRFGKYLDSAALLGRRTAELHIALAAQTDLPQFGRQPFSPFSQRLLYQSMRELAARSLSALRRQLSSVPTDVESECEELLAREDEVFERLHRIVGRKIDSLCIRCHGDYHLGQVLYTGDDFVIIDFEGEPARSIRERQFKSSPFRDIAGMLRSFDYAAYQALREPCDGNVLEPTARVQFAPWMHFWTTWTSAAFLNSYLETAHDQPFVPRRAENGQSLLEVHMLEKALYELRYELNNRPDWVGIPLHGILDLLGAAHNN